MVIIGGGFGGINVAKGLVHAPVNVTLIDRGNIHLFQPLLYQVATGGLSPGDIASPLRGVLGKADNIAVLMAEVTDIDPDRQMVIHKRGETPYDYLVIAAGAETSYFGNDQWGEHAPSLKSIEDALEIRRKILLAFEEAEADPETVDVEQTFVIVGGGPTGVELAGAVGELARKTLKGNFRRIDPKKSRILLLEAVDQLLPGYPVELAGEASRFLHKLGVEVQTGTKVTDIKDTYVMVEHDGEEARIETSNLFWAAGVQPVPLAATIAERFGLELVKRKLPVQPDLSLPDHGTIFAIGDLAYLEDEAGEPLPGVAPVAIQQGQYLGDLIRKRVNGQSSKAFRYRDKGMLAVIGRNAAVAKVGRWKLSGMIAWFVWAIVHIFFLIGYDNKLLVSIQWIMNYLTRKRGARLITKTYAVGED